MTQCDQPTCWIIAGPNGAGKTTFALKYLPEVVNCRQFVNADLIAAGLSPLAPEKELLTASRMYLQNVEYYIQKKQNFAFETTLAGRGYLKLIHRLNKSGWRVELIYLALPSVEMSKMRVAERVAHGGHNIPIADIERRFSRSLRNLFDLFSHQVDRTLCLLNSGARQELVFVQQRRDRNVIHNEHFNLLVQKAGL